MLKTLDLFSGIGGFSLGLENTGGFQTVAFCEIEEYAQKVLKRHWPDVPIFEDVRTLKGSDIGPVDLITAGYPCQPFSMAGKRQGAQDDRHLWPEVNRLLAELRPNWFIGENVAGHVSMGLDEVLSDLEKQNYTARPFIIPACALDAPHRRERLWIVAHANSERKPQQSGGRSEKRERAGHRSEKSETVANAVSQGLERHSGNGKDRHQSRWVNEGHNRPTRQSGICKPLPDADGNNKQRRCFSEQMGGQRVKKEDVRNGDQRGIEWPAEPDVGRVAHGVPHRVDRLRGLGNAVVSQIPELLGNMILEIEDNGQASTLSA